jgi:hypothetical protein
VSAEKSAQKKVAIVQSNYIPWKGYFDLIHSVDEFILYDDVQYTKRDWRNRNLIKTSAGLQWLSIPIEVKGNRFQAVKDAKVSAPLWGEKHWNSLTAAYGRAPYFKEYKPIFEQLYRGPCSPMLSEINLAFIRAICALLGIHTPIRFSMDYAFERGDKNVQLISLCEQAGATHYLSGPAAAVYLEAGAFAKQGIELSLFDYSGYPEYRQAHPPFVHGVTVLDLLFNEGPQAGRYLKTLGAPTPRISTSAELQV